MSFHYSHSPYIPGNVGTEQGQASTPTYGLQQSRSGFLQSAFQSFGAGLSHSYSGDAFTPGKHPWDTPERAALNFEKPSLLHKYDPAYRKYISDKFSEKRDRLENPQQSEAFSGGSLTSGWRSVSVQPQEGFQPGFYNQTAYQPGAQRTGGFQPGFYQNQL